MANYLTFVYGTLKRGQPNHGLLQDANKGVSKLLGLGSVCDAYPLVISSQYNIPFLLLLRGTGEIVEGEVFEVDEKMVASLDELESHPEFYQRFQVPIDLTTDDTGTPLQTPKRLECWCYFLTNFKPKLLELPFLKSYDSRGSHGLMYTPRYTRRAAENYDILSDVKL